MEVHRSARKHGVPDDDAVHAAAHFLVAYRLNDEDASGPVRELRLGPDRAGNMLEVVVLMLDDGNELVIHADAAQVPGPSPITNDYEPAGRM